MNGRSLSSEPLRHDSEPPSALQLTVDAQRIWSELLEILPSGLILESDQLEFGRYAQLLSDRDELRQVLSERGRTILLTDEAGAVRSEKPRPEVSALYKTESELRLLGSLLGLTPGARQRVSVSAQAESDDLDQQLFG